MSKSLNSVFANYLEINEFTNKYCSTDRIEFKCIKNSASSVLIYPEIKTLEAMNVAVSFARQFPHCKLVTGKFIFTARTVDKLAYFGS